jgi:hypothetical protein
VTDQPHPPSPPTHTAHVLVGDEIVLPRPPTLTGYTYRAPQYYPRRLRQIANLIEALTAFEEDDTTMKEGAGYVGFFELPIYDSEDQQGGDPEDPYNGLQGWVCQLDEQCWVFVPHIPELLPAKEIPDE